MSGLRVNFIKRKLYGVNLNSYFILSASLYLNCCIDSLPFKFLGMVVGASPRRVSMWKGVVDTVKRGLYSWKGRGLSMGGRFFLDKFGFEWDYFLHALVL